MQLTLMDKVISAKCDNDSLMKIVDLFEPKLKKSLYNTSEPNREDLLQDLKLKLVTCIRQYDVESIPGFWEMKEK